MMQTPHLTDGAREFTALMFKLFTLYNEREAAIWLTSKQRVLDNKVPIDLIKEGRVRDCQKAIDVVLEGTFT